MVTPLIDSDVLLYEVGYAGQDKEGPKSWENVKEIFDNKVALICDEVRATTPPQLFLTNTRRINKMLNKQRKWLDEPVVEFKDNFRFQEAKEKEYKGNRKEDKPFHFYNILAHVLSSYDYKVNENGLEADDLMCITQYNSKDTIICSRDKDVKQCPGLHYVWECGKQASRGPFEVDYLGYIVEEESKKERKFFATGMKLFYYQLLTGDIVDNIGGVKGRGPVFAYDLLKDATSERECYELVGEVYVKTHGDEWKDKLNEQAKLLYMIKELDENNNPIHWQPPERGEDE